MALGLVFTALGEERAGAQAQSVRGDLYEVRKVSTLIGKGVLNHSNVRIAVIRDLVVSPEGALLYAVLGYDGVAGVGETLTAVPYQLLGIRHDDGNWAVNLDMPAAVLAEAPTINSEDYCELTNPKWIARLDQFIRGSGASVHHPNRTLGAVRRELRIVKIVLRASNVLDASLTNTEQDDLGEVEELLLDRKNHIVFAIIGWGGMLGIGENHIPVPWSILALGENRQNGTVKITIDATKDDFENAPLVKGDDYATVLDPGFADEVRRYFGAN